MHAWAALALALSAAVACRDDARLPLLAVSTTPSRASIDSLRALGHYQAALATAHARQRALDHTPGSPGWMRDDARREIGTLIQIAAAPDSVRRAFAIADAAGVRADSLDATGDPLAAIDVLRAQLATRRRLLGPEHEEIAASSSALAMRLANQGDVLDSYRLDQEALAMRRHILGRRHPDVAESLDQLGRDLKAAGTARDESMRLYRQGLQIRQELLGPESPEAMVSLMNIANLYRLKQQPDSAMAIFRRVLDHRRKSTGADHERTGDVLFSMAMTLTPRGKWSEAEPLLREAVAFQRALGQPGRLSLAHALNAHGLALRHLNRLDEAEPALYESIAIYEELRRGAVHGMDIARVLPLSTYGFLAATQLERGHTSEAWWTLECSLGRMLTEVLAARGAIDTTGWWDAHALERVQRSLSDDAAVIGWLALRPGASPEEYPFWCYCIRRTGPPHWQQVDAPSPEAARAADLPLDIMTRELRRAASWPLQVPVTPEITALARAAYDRRFAPLEPWLHGVQRLVVVSPDLLHGAPVESFVDSSGRWLSDRFVITYAPSALLYASTRGSRPSRAGGAAAWRALLIGDPDPEHSTEGAAPPPRLVAAEAEVRDIASLTHSPTLLLGPDASERHLRALAASGSLERFDLIHFATHASVDDIWSGRSALVLSPAAPESASHRAPGAAPAAGRIAVDEILESWRLDADLVTLAACKSLIGPTSATEGYLGLHMALLGAGARNVVVSIRAVDDRATALLMGHFYRVLLAAPNRAHGPAASADADIASALAEARRWLCHWRAPDGTTPYAHPVYWAGFVLVCGGGSPRIADGGSSRHDGAVAASPSR